jgi:ABC-type proline/glycine betaine transport system substrate-binding protein
MTTIKSKKRARLQFFTAMTTCQGLCLVIGICLVLMPAAGQKATAQLQPMLFVSAEDQRRAGGETIVLARATWDTGWFQTEILKKFLEELGCTVKKPQTKENMAFYLAAARGEVDLWANGWFPSHHLFVEDERVRGRVEAVGFEVKAGALQGYLVDKKTADAKGITNLGDLKDPKIAAVFDRNGNGKADLIGCNVGWGCERVVEHHLDAYELRATVEHIQGDYAPMMDETIGRYLRGDPILFYTWTPNWTVGNLVPGKDVVWIEVPFASLPKEKKTLKAKRPSKAFPDVWTIPVRWDFHPTTSALWPTNNFWTIIRMSDVCWNWSKFR